MNRKNEGIMNKLSKRDAMEGFGMTLHIITSAGGKKHE